MFFPLICLIFPYWRQLIFLLYLWQHIIVMMCLEHFWSDKKKCCIYRQYIIKKKKKKSNPSSIPFLMWCRFAKREPQDHNMEYVAKTQNSQAEELAYLEKLLCPWRQRDSASWWLFPFCLTKHARHYFITPVFLLKARVPTVLIESPLSLSGSTVLIGFHFPVAHEKRIGHHMYKRRVIFYT